MSLFDLKKKHGFKPRGTKVLVQHIKPTDDSIVIPEGLYEEGMRLGKVLSCGSTAVGIEVGSNVIFELYPNRHMKIAGEDHYIIDDDDILMSE